MDQESEGTNLVIFVVGGVVLLLLLLGGGALFFLRSEAVADMPPIMEGAPELERIKGGGPVHDDVEAVENVAPNETPRAEPKERNQEPPPPPPK